MTGSRRVLQVGIHATLRPIHGGQLRSHHIGRVLEAAGYTVRGIVTGWRQDHDIVGDREVILDVGPPENLSLPVAGGGFMDFFLCTAAEENPVLRAEFFRLAALAGPDAVLLEQPWMWPLVRQIPEVAGGHAPVIYNSQNVESHLKREIVADSGLDSVTLAEAERLARAVETLEHDVVTRAAAVTACTAEDAAIFAGWGARRTVIAGNGSSRRTASGLRHPLPAVIPKGCRYAIMVGSPHPPNVTGFENLVLPWLASLRPGERVVVAGGAGDVLRGRLARRGLAEALAGRLVLLGRVNDLTLTALIENAACILLPIEYGGGSNVKTAEALLADRRIVASAFSMRGFEAYQGLPGVAVANGASEFGVAARSALADGSPVYRGAAADALSWDAMLRPLVTLVGELVGGVRSGRSLRGG